MPKILKSISDVRDFTELYNLVNRRIGLVPTMGALHDGHIRLGERARQECDCLIYSIFVNPLQFGKNEDLHKYPRNIQHDLEKLDEIGTDAVFIPDEKTMYPQGYSTYVDIGQIGDILCGRTRPGHFKGVATVVLKLFNIVGCDQAYFGKKDYQQYIILKKIIKDLNLPVDIIGIDTVREDDGLAMSSRNDYLTDKKRSAAPVIYKALAAAKKHFAGYETKADIISDAKDTIEKERSADIEYIELRNAEDLSEVKDIRKEKVILITAVRFGDTRLIDNMILN